MVNQNWYYMKNSVQHGPVSPKELKALADAGEIIGTDLVRTESMEKWTKASSVKGLIRLAATVTPPSSTVGPPPIPASSSSPVKETEKGFRRTIGQRLLATIGSIVRTTKAAGVAAARQAELTRITNIDLPKAFAKLGDEIRHTNQFRSELSEIHLRIDALEEKLRENQDAAQQKEEKDGVKGAASKIARMTRLKAEEASLRLQRSKLLKELGASSYEKYSEKAGSQTVTSEIARLQSRLFELAGNESQAVTSPHRSIVSGRRLKIGATVCVGLALTLLFFGYLRVGKQSHSSSELDSMLGQSATETGQHIQVNDRSLLPIPNTEIDHLELSPDGSLLKTDYLNFWNLKSKQKLAYSTEAWPGRMSSDWSLYAAVERKEQKSLIVFDVGATSLTEKQRITIPSTWDGFRLGAWSLNNQKLAMFNQSSLVSDSIGLVIDRAAEPRTIELLASKEVSDDVRSHGLGYTESIFSPDSQLLCVGFNEPCICVYETRTGRCVKTIQMPEVRSPSEFKWHGFTADGQALITSFQNASENFSPILRTITFWDTRTWKKKFEIRGASNDADEQFCCLIENDQKFVTTTKQNRERVIRSTIDGKEIKRVRLVRAFDRKRQLLTYDSTKAFVILEGDGRLELWDLLEDDLRAVLGSSDKVERMKVSIAANAPIVASAKLLGTDQVEIWNLKQGVPANSAVYLSETKSGMEERGPVYFTVTDLEREEGWETPETASGPYRMPAPPVTRESYSKLRVGMRQREVDELLGGRSHKELYKSGRVTTGVLAKDWWKTTRVYVGETPGSIVELQFERNTGTGAIGEDELTSKNQRGL